jgi:hypothetical protein
MFGLLAFAAVIVLLVVLPGAPYPQSWAQRWGTSVR